jgi:polyferredoxin
MEGPKSDALAIVNNDKCISCFRCIDVCDDDAMFAFERETPMEVGTPLEDSDMPAIADLCHRAHLDPEYNACLCSSTPVKEIAAAILRGAHTFEEVALQTGAQSGCLMYCFAPIHRLLKAHLGEVAPSSIKNKWYGSSQGIHEVPPDVADRHPKFFLREEQDALLALEAAQIAALHR